MTKYREILRLKSLGFSDRNIARSCSVSRNTVRRVIDRADELSISWPLDFGMTDGALGELLFPSEKSATDRRL
ncbi:Homeodomain-like domain-containing protein, partial [Eubacterium pyruvativorans]